MTDEDVVEAVLLASRALVAVAARSLGAAPEEVTLPQYRALVVLSTQGTRSVSELATDLGTAASSVTRLCDRLVRKGLIVRAESSGNRRQTDLDVTAAGRDLVQQVTAARLQEISRLVKAIPAARRPLVAEALSELGRAAGEVPEQVWSLGWT
ncbi:MAG TPA: MarR family transcriptional regulator [Acidimicrobiales bacterium]|nr:MarR family transcriptional regulator [Acidimicrobiales bacterium]